jgi:rieske iron-sulfur protein
MESNFCKSRRDLLKSACGLVGATALVSIGGSLSAFAGPGAMPRPKDNGVPLVGDTFVFGDGQSKGNVVFLEDLVIGGPPVVAQAKDAASGTVRESDHSTVLLLRLPPEKVPPELKEDAAQGVLAYSAVCTHLGCLLTDWVENKKLFRCPCHEAMFDPMQAGKSTGEGPASRMLPILPLKVEDGKLIVADVFTGPVGPKRG